jgi:hypothetical protein
VFTDNVQKIRELLSHQDHDFECQGLELMMALDESELTLLREGCLLRSIHFGKNSLRWIPEFTGWPGIKDNKKVTSAMLEILFRFSTESEKIEHLSIHGFSSVRNVDFLQHLPNLKSFSGTWCKGLTDIQGMSGHTMLEKVELTGSSLLNLKPLADLQRLLYLYLGFSELTEKHCAVIKGLPKLVSLEIENLKNLSSLDYICHLPRLIFLNIHDCPNVQNVDGFCELPKLRSVKITRCAGLENVNGLASCLALKEVDLSVMGVWEPDYQQYMRGGHSLVSIEGLMDLPDLDIVNLSNQTLLPESQLQQLRSKTKRLILKGCKVD